MRSGDPYRYPEPEADLPPDDAAAAEGAPIAGLIWGILFSMPIWAVIGIFVYRLISN